MTNTLGSKTKGQGQNLTSLLSSAAVQIQTARTRDTVSVTRAWW